MENNHVRDALAQLVSGECLTDKEIAARFDVSVGTIVNWRRKFGIAPAKKYQRNFENKYGQGSVERLRRLVADNATLHDIGAQFGFSGEYARQVCAKLGIERERVTRAS